MKSNLLFSTGDNMKINEMYLIFDKNNELVKNYFTTSGQAQCNRYGCISLKQEIDSLRDLIKSYEEVKKKKIKECAK